jgi:hypothetical protein
VINKSSHVDKMNIIIVRNSEFFLKPVENYLGRKEEYKKFKVACV